MSKKVKLIAIDCGKMNMKAKCEGKELIYGNKFSYGFSDPQMKGDKTWNVVYDGEEYTVGDTGMRSDRDEGKASVEHILCALTCVTRFLKADDKNDNIKLVYGESASKYFNTEHKDRVISKLQGRHEIIVDGVEYDFKITEVIVLPEGIGHILSDIDNNLGTQYVVDIGGKTINFLTVYNGRPLQEKSFSTGLGFNSIVSKVMERCNRDSSIGKVSELSIIDAVTHGSPRSEINNIIRKVVKDQFREFDDRVFDTDVNIHKEIENHGVTFIGGCSSLFEDDIKDYYSSRITIVDEPVFANVRGFYVYGLAKFDLEV